MRRTRRGSSRPARRPWKQMDEASKKLVTAAADSEPALGRVMTAGEYQAKFPGNTINNGATEVPILGDYPEANYLPVMTSGVLANPQKFKNRLPGVRSHG